MSIRKTSAGKYEVRYREGSRHRSKTFSRPKDAQRFETEVKYRRENGEPVIRSKDVPLLNDFASDWVARRTLEGLSEGTLSFNATILDRHISPTLGHLRLTDLTYDRLLAWQADAHARGSSPLMLNRAREVLGQLLVEAERRGYVPFNAALLLKKLKHETREGVVATPEQVEAMRNYLIEEKRLGYATLVSVLAYVGLRPQEALALSWSSLKGDHLVVDRRAVNGSITRGTKTNKPRFPSVPAPVVADLAEWRTDGTGLIFPRSSDGLPWRKTDWDNWRNRWLRAAAGAAGILTWNVDTKKWEGDFVPYDLRHTCASLMIRANIPLTEVAEHMGHGLDVLSGTYAHDISSMRRQPARPIEEMITSARGDVRRLYGQRAS